MDVRLAAVRVIADLLAQEGSLATRLPPMLDAVSPEDRSLLQELCYGTLRWYPRLSLILNDLLSRPLRQKEYQVRALLLCGLYQLMEMRVPQHAAVHETVRIASRLGKPWAQSLTNAILRGFLRRRYELEQNLSDRLEYRYAHPHWLQEQLRRAWPEDWPTILEAGNLRPPMTLRVNRRRIERTDYLDRLRAAGIAAHQATLSPEGIYLEAAVDVALLPGFCEGLVSVQDEASQLAVPLLDLRPGQRVLDACSAPGGKTCHILETTCDLDEVVAVEVDSRRAARVCENLRRLQLSATLVTADAGNLAAWWDGRPFDRILLDAPCSASGVIRRHPDIKLLRRAKDIDKLVSTQGALLEAVWKSLKPGGRLLYTTCSVLPAENDGVMAAFVDRQPDARLVPIMASWGRKTSTGRQLLPQTDGHDGFFYARLEKRRSSESDEQ